MKLALIICNEIIGMLIESIEKNEQLMIVNGMRQKFVKGDGLFIYRQKDPINFFKLFGVKSTGIEQNMTNDGTLNFKTISQANKAFDILSKCHLNTGEKLFYVEKISKQRIFIQLDLNHIIEKIIDDAYNENYSELYKFENALKDPYNKINNKKFITPPLDNEKVFETFCGT